MGESSTKSPDFDSNSKNYFAKEFEKKKLKNFYSSAKVFCFAFKISLC